MSVVIRPADLQSDRAQLIRLLSETLSSSADAQRFDWLYLKILTVPREPGLRKTARRDITWAPAPSFRGA